MKKYKISVVVTYHNENYNIEKTLHQLFKQTYKPSEIIFINSDSTDFSYEILQKKIKQLRLKYNIKNYTNLKSPYPSTSKNLGIQLAKYPFIAFMDCGIKFSKNWLKNKIRLLNKSNSEAVISSCKLSGYNSFDKACVANTYGLNKKNLCIPGSLIKKNIFSKIGYFENSRSLYDVIWKEKLKNSKINYISDYKNYIEYDGINYAKDSTALFRKNIEYFKDILHIEKNTKTKYYLITPFLALSLLLYNFYFFLTMTILYFVIRVVIAKIKCYKNLSLTNFYLIFQVCITGCIIDTARIVGSYRALLTYVGINSFLSLFFLFYILFFSSPFMSIFSNNLMMHKNKLNINETNAIVVFSGDGHISYNNETYKQRALEAINYSSNLNIKKIFLSSGREQSIQDTELLKLFLISNNTNPDQIYIFEKNPNSTYANIRMVGEHLIKNNYNNIIFLTGPIHNKRSILIWKKQFPQINIFVPEIKETIKWTFNLNEILIIFYEYFAITYNFFQKRL